MAHPVKSKKDAAAAAAGDAEAGLLRANVVQTFCRCFFKARASTDVDSMAGGRESKRKRDSAGRAGAPQLKDIMSAIDLELAMKGMDPLASVKEFMSLVIGEGLPLAGAKFSNQSSINRSATAVTLTLKHSMVQYEWSVDPEAQKLLCVPGQVAACKATLETTDT